MPRGLSGRIVLEIDPKLKKELYSELVREGSTLKDWFIREAKKYIFSKMGENPIYRKTSIDQEGG